MDEIFRFSLTRPPQRQPAGVLAEHVVPGRLSPAAQAWRRMNPGPAGEAASRFIASPEYVRSLAKAWPHLAALDDWVLAHPRFRNEEIAAAVENIFGKPPGHVVRQDDFTAAETRLADSLFARTLASTSNVGTGHLVRGLRLLDAVRRLADGARITTIRSALDAEVVLPAPPPRGGAPATVPAPEAEKPGDTATAFRRYLELSSDLYKLAGLAMRTQPTIELMGGATRVPSEAEMLARYRTIRNVSPGDLQALSKQSQALLAQEYGDREIIELREVRSALEARLAWLGSLPFLTFFFGPASRRLAPVSTGIARIAGISDLLLVRQTHTRYEPGEISHIENILPGEQFARQFRRSTSVETFEESESERTESSERELQTTTRAELRSEVRRTLQERLSFEAGASVNYSGPSIEVGVDARFAYERATEEARQTASTFARDVVDRAASTLEETAREYRSTRRRTDTEDLANRGVANDTPEAVVGVYRWVDRIVGFELVNYDRRLLVEFVIPEPAAYYRYVTGGRAPRGITAVEPAPLLADASGLPAVEGQPLHAGQITEATYLIWVARYGVSGVTPPPPTRVSVGIAGSLEESPSGDSDSGDSRAKVLEPGSLSVPTGYVATDMEVAVASEYDDASRFYDIKIGAATIKREPYYYGREGLAPAGMSGNVPVSILAKNYENLTVNIVLECTRTEHALVEWQLQTYETILGEYRRQLAEYHDQLSGARIQDEVAGGQGTHPLTLQDFERTEVKRSAIMAITGQSFDLFDAVREAPGGAPTELSFDDVAAEGSYIQFLEQAFEWDAMSYVFYPYFWGRKQEWAGVAFEEHVDALFARFLRAGAARVVAPVRPGFEDAVRFFLDTGKPWLGGDAPVIDEEAPEEEDPAGGGGDMPSPPPFLHVAEELREQLGVDFHEGEGAIGATTGERTIDTSGATLEGEWTGRKLRIGGANYRVQRADSDGSTATLDRPFEGEAGAHPFAVGPRVVGLPWETRLPTTLVVLDGEAVEFPVIRLD